MKNNMKLIMESWRRNVLQEQDNPGTVGELLQGLNAYILSNSDQLKRVAQAIANALEGIMDALGDIDEATKKSIEEFASGAIEFLKSVQEKGLKDAIKEKGKDIAKNVLTTVAKNEIIALNTKHCNANSIAIAVGEDAQVTQAYTLGIVKTAKVRNEEELASIKAADEAAAKANQTGN